MYRIGRHITMCASYGLSGLMAIVGAICLMACSSSDDISVNPNYNPETQTVKSQITLSLPAKVTTRMGATTVQQTGFRGITDIYLLPFNTTITNSNKNISINGDLIRLGDITAGEPTTPDGQKLNTDLKNSVVYNGKEIKTNTTTFIFYGKALGEKEERDADDKFELGSIVTSNVSDEMKDVNNVKFILDPITVSTAECAGSAKGKKLRELLNNIAHATYSPTTYNSYSWAESSDAALKALYDTFITLVAGSSNSVQSVLGTLYNTMYSFASDVNPDNIIAKEIATNIRDIIIAACSENPPAADATTITLDDDYQGYPADVYLPDGVARVKWITLPTSTTTEVPAFEGMTTANSSFGNYAPPGAYTFPASLRYWVNSPLVAASEMKSQDFGKEGISSWADIVKTSTGGVYYNAYTKVMENTASIAIKNQIQYAVGRLDTYVQVEDNVTLKDNDEATVAVPDGGFTLTGVLIGGQKEVGWNFEPTGSGTEYTIYDRDVVSGIRALTTGFSAPNYTLALQTPPNVDVTVALEFTNGDQMFRGADGYIPPGGKFYLLADLVPKITSESGNADNPGVTGNCVFKQDYVTIAKFTIGADGLKNAFNTLPDLRKPDLELGLTVNLSWHQGLTYNMHFNE